MSSSLNADYPNTINIQQVTVYYIFRKCFEKIGRKKELLELKLWSSHLYKEMEKTLGNDPRFNQWFIMGKETKRKYFDTLYLTAKKAILNDRLHIEIASPRSMEFLPLLVFSGFEHQYGYLDTCLGHNENQQLFMIRESKADGPIFVMTLDEADFDRRVLGRLPVYTSTTQPLSDHIDTMVNQLSEKVEIRLRYLLPAPPVYFVGRGDQINECHRLLTEPGQPDKVLLLHGIGGMGKTTMMQQYLHQNNCQSHFNRIVYMVIDHDLLNAYIDTAARVLKCSEQVNTLTTVNAQLLLIVELMSEFEGENLFVIDNVNESDFEQLRLLKEHFVQSGWKYLITTRTAPDGFLVYNVDELEMDNAMLLFASHWWPHLVLPGDLLSTNIKLRQKIVDTGLNDDLKALLEHIFRHTLLTELLAKAGRKKGLTVKELHERLIEDDYRHKDLNRNIDSGTYRKGKLQINETKLHNYMLGLFDTTYLLAFTGDNLIDVENEAKAIMLLFFSVLPATDIPLSDLLLLWNIKQPDTNDFEDRLDDLRQIGWLQGKYNYTEEEGRYTVDYKMHKLIQDVVKEKLKPTLQDCLPLIETLNHIVSARQSSPEKYQNYAESIIRRFGIG